MDSGVLSDEFNFRIIYQIAGVLFVLSCVYCSIKAKRFSLPSLPDFNFSLVLSLLTTGFFGLALACKYSQAEALAFSANDFWLFDDMLYWWAEGKPYLTRFTFHGEGPFQHGVVHAFFSMGLFLPLVWIFGPTITAILINPLSLAVGGYFLGRLTYWMTKSKKASIGLTIAFFISEWTSRPLMYETHPETMYPVAIILAFAASFAFGRRADSKAWIAILLSWAFLAGIKQDALVVGFGLWAALTFSRTLNFRNSVSALFALVGTVGLMTYAISKFKAGAGADVVTIGSFDVDVVRRAVGPALLAGKPLGGFGDFINLFLFFTERAGGALSLFVKLISYPFREPFLLFALTAPWLWLKFRTWIVLMSVAFPLALVGGQGGGLQIYYPAALIGLLFVCVVWELMESESKNVKAKVAWIILISAIHGGSGLTYYQAKPEASAMLQEASVITKDLDGLGVVSSRILLNFDRDRVWSDRPKLDGEMPAAVKWVLLPKNHASYDFPEEKQAQWQRFAMNSGDWEVRSGKLLNLYVRK